VTGGGPEIRARPGMGIGSVHHTQLDAGRPWAARAFDHRVPNRANGLLVLMIHVIAISGWKPDQPQLYVSWAPKLAGLFCFESVGRDRRDLGAPGAATAGENAESADAIHGHMGGSETIASSIRGATRLMPRRNSARPGRVDAGGDRNQSSLGGFDVAGKTPLRAHHAGSRSGRGF